MPPREFHRSFPAALTTALATGLVLGTALATPPPATHTGPVPWLDADGRPTSAALRAIRMLGESEQDGLEATDYQARPLADRAAGLHHRPGTDPRFSAELERSLRRFEEDLHEGRVRPDEVGFMIPPALARGRGAAEDVGVAAEADRLPGWRESLRPRLPLYRELAAALKTYRALAGREPDPPLELPPKPLHAGDPYAGAARLRATLVRLGDMDTAETPVEDSRYDAALAAGIATFQARHGLLSDGVLGVETRRALSVPLSERVRQIELAMERLRWLPSLSGRKIIGINVPLFTLWAADLTQESPRRLEMGVIAGKAVSHQSPMLFAAVDRVTFRPYWNIPGSIAVRELLGKAGQDPGYLSRHHIEVVDGPGDRARVVPPDRRALEQVRLGRLRLRQRPGADNALGLIKFEMPNAQQVYLHDTPARNAFRAARRDLSHGCIRVEQPVALAALLLSDPGRWSEPDVRRAMDGDTTFSVRLADPWWVILYYLTAMVGPGDGKVRFAEDIYGHDARLRDALARRSARLASGD